MVMKKLKLILAFFLAIFLVACSEKTTEPDPTPDPNLDKASCIGCHTDYNHLKAVHTPDPPDPGGGGCGGEIPHIEPYDRVYLGGPGYDEFKNSSHGQMSCTTCHKGVDNNADKNVAHSGDFIAKPSADAETFCGSCHQSIVNQTKNSIHEQGWGQKTWSL
jgi:hypothetical protein